MRRKHSTYYILLAVFMAACLFFPSCISAAHTAEHACFHYDDCRLCQQLDSGKTIGTLALALLPVCAFMHISTHARCDHARRCFVPLTLISQSIQMND